MNECQQSMFGGNGYCGFGKCIIINESSSYCKCNDGFINDKSFTRQMNCYLPINIIDKLSYIGLSLSILSLLITFIPLKQSHSIIYHVSIINTLFSLITCLLFIVYIYNNFIGNITVLTFMWLTISFGSGLLNMATYSLMIPLYKAIHQDINKFKHKQIIIFVLFRFIGLIIIIISSLFDDINDINKYIIYSYISETIVFILSIETFVAYGGLILHSDKMVKLIIDLQIKNQDTYQSNGIQSQTQTQQHQLQSQSQQYQQQQSQSQIHDSSSSPSNQRSSLPFTFISSISRVNIIGIIGNSNTDNTNNNNITTTNTNTTNNNNNNNTNLTNNINTKNKNNKNDKYNKFIIKLKNTKTQSIIGMSSIGAITFISSMIQFIFGSIPFVFVFFILGGYNAPLLSIIISLFSIKGSSNDNNNNNNNNNNNSNKGTKSSHNGSSRTSKTDNLITNRKIANAKYAVSVDNNTYSSPSSFKTFNDSKSNRTIFNDTIIISTIGGDNNENNNNNNEDDDEQQQHQHHQQQQQHQQQGNGEDNNENINININTNINNTNINRINEDNESEIVREVSLKNVDQSVW